MGRSNALIGMVLLCGPTVAAATALSPQVHSGDAPEVEAASSVPAVWAVDPAQPGEDLPVRGHSVFDAIFSVHKNGAAEYQLPFPFVALVRKIEGNLYRGDRANSRSRQVLIPMGRSLQRHAAAPDYFEYPRVVVAVDSAFEDPDLVPVKDRLFLGYQEKANIIEVISYNEDAGRFEFQIVHDYAENSSPRVVYARRQVCISCHQNGGPIFPVAAWSETAANPNVSRRLFDEHSTYSGIPIDRSAVDAFAVDAASDRANLFAVYQRLWREGCGADTGRARRCRAAAFTAMLQYRLTGRTQFDTRSPDYREHFLDPFTDNWTRRWPGGIKIPNPDLPNRDPLTSPASLSARLDPLVLRPPLETWSLTQASDVEPMVKGIAEFLPERDIRELDTYLFERSRPDAADRFTGACTLRAKPTSGSAYRIGFDCRPPRYTRHGFAMKGRIYTRDERVTDGVIDVLELNSGYSVSRLKISSAGLELRDGSWQVDVDLFQQPSGLHARLSNGNALRLRLHWVDADASATTSVSETSVIPGGATLFMMTDFARVRRAIEELTNADGDETFSSTALHGARAMRSLAVRLEMVPAGKTCCSREVAMPSVRVDDGDLPGFPSLLAGAREFQTLQPFFQYCAGCHQSTATFPPNFLSGDPTQIRHSLVNCAQRIWYRLGMWDVPEQQRPKSPMPPKTTLGSDDDSAQQWVKSDELLQLRSYIAAVLDAQNVDRSSLINRDYKMLRECTGYAG